MKLFYLSHTSFSDCEIKLLINLASTHDVTYAVLIPKKNNNFTEDELTLAFKDSKVKFFPINLKFRQRDPRQLAAFYSLIKTIKKSNPDIIYINDFLDIYLDLMVALLIKKENAIIGKHDVENHSGMQNKFFLDISRTILPLKFSNFLTFSTTQAAIFRSQYPEKRIFTIPLHLKDFGPKVAHQRHSATTRFLFFGNIRPYKGLDILLVALNNLSKKYKNFVLEIAGRSNEWNEVYAPLLENENFIIKKIGFIDNCDIPDFFSRADYLILPYKDVTQSGPLMIAYNYNVPVIASNLDGFKEFIQDGQTGFLFNSDDTDSLENILEQALNRSELEYQYLIENLEKYKSLNFSEKVITDKYEQLFQTVIENES